MVGSLLPVANSATINPLNAPRDRQLRLPWTPIAIGTPFAIISARSSAIVSLAIEQANAGLQSRSLVVKRER